MAKYKFDSFHICASCRKNFQFSILLLFLTFVRKIIQLNFPYCTVAVPASTHLFCNSESTQFWSIYLCQNWSCLICLSQVMLNFIVYFSIMCRFLTHSWLPRLMKNTMCPEAIVMLLAKMNLWVTICDHFWFCIKKEVIYFHVSHKPGIISMYHTILYHTVYHLFWELHFSICTAA